MFMIWILAALLQASVPPEHVAAFSRIDTVSSYPSSASSCNMLGYTVSDNFPDVLAERVIAEAKEAGVSEATASSWASEGIRRHGASFERDLRTAQSLSTETEIAASVKAVFDMLSSKCETVAADPISRGILTAGTPEAMREARAEVEDPLLAGVGAASWQTPAIWARGELLVGLGVCKNRLPSEQHDQLLAEHLPASSDTSPAGSWMAGQYVEGIRSSANMVLDATQCRRLITTRIAAYNAATR